jgi:hypothetical protein
MKLDIINNYKTIYYNLLTNFYLILNLFIPMYNNVVISMHNEATRSLIGNEKKIKRIRMIEFIKDLENNDKIILDKNNNLLLVEYSYDDYIVEDSDNDSLYDDDNIKKIENIFSNNIIINELKKLIDNSKKNN